MGASSWEYLTPYAGSVEASLEALHAQVFQQKYGGTDAYRSLAELRADEAFIGEEGTHSILDIHRVVHTADVPDPDRDEDYNTLRPLGSDRLAHYFGTDRPSVRQYEEQIAAAHQADRFEESLLEECRMRWTGVYVLLHTDSQPTHLGVFGYSGD
jgi:hypothetical protein